MEISRHWRLNPQRYQLAGSMCLRCGKSQVAPRPVCAACQQEFGSPVAANSQPAAASSLQFADK